MDRITRRELKADKFAAEVTHTVEYVGEHRRQVMTYGGVAIAIIVLAVGVYFYRQRQHSLRQSDLVAAMETYDGYVGAAPQGGFRAKLFNTKEEKDKAIQKVFADLVVNHGGSDEGYIGQYYLGVIASDKGNTAEAEKRFREVADNGSNDYASLAKMALAQMEQSRGRLPEAEKLLRSLMDKPTMLVSREQATISLAKLIGKARPEDARKLLEPLRTNQRTAVSRAAITELSELPKVELPPPPAAKPDPAKKTPAAK